MAFRRDRLRALREEVRLTQAELAERTGITARTIQRYEEDDGTEPKLSDAALLAKTLMTTTDYLAGLTDDSTPNMSQGDLSPRQRALLNAASKRLMPEALEALAAIAKEGD